MIVKTYEELFGKKLTIRDLINGFNENTKNNFTEKKTLIIVGHT